MNGFSFVYVTLLIAVRHYSEALVHDENGFRILRWTNLGNYSERHALVTPKPGRDTFFGRISILDIWMNEHSKLQAPYVATGGDDTHMDGGCWHPFDSRFLGIAPPHGLGCG